MDLQNLLEKIFDRQLIPLGSKRIMRLVMLVIWGLLIILLLWTAWNSRNQIVPLIIGADYSRIYMVFVYYFVNIIATIIGWHIIMQSFNDRLSWWRNVQIFCSTYALRRLPGTVWYVGGRMVLYQKLGMSKLAILQASTIELIVALISGGFLGLGIFMSLRVELPSVLLIAVFLCLIFGVVILYPSILKRRFKNVESHLLRDYGFLKPTIWIITYSFVWVIGGLMVSQIVSIVQSVGWSEIGYITGSWIFSGMAGLLTIFLPTTFGAAELSLTAFLSQIIPLPLAGAVAISTRLLTLSMEMLISVFFYPIMVKFPLDKESKE